MYMLHIAKGGDSNLEVKNRTSRLLESFRYIKTQSGCLVINVYPKWRLGDKCICNEESLNILGNVFNRGGNNASHVTNRLTKCRQSFYVLRSAGMLYPGATPDVQAVSV